MKVVERASNDVLWCMHDLLTRLPPFKHVLWLSTPLILKLKIFSELWESSSINLENFLNHKKQI
jgi:hypothetical protein